MKPIVIGDLNLARCFGMAKIPYVVLTDHGRAITYSRYCNRGYSIPNPEQAPDDAYEMLKKISSSAIEPNPIFYSNDGHLKMIIENYDDFCERFRAVLPDKEILSACIDKHKFSTFSYQHELPVPQTIDLQPGIKIKETGPLVLKPMTRVNWWHNARIQEELGSKYKAITVRNENELQYWMDFLAEAKIKYLAQQLVEGPESNIFSYHCFIDDTHVTLAFFIGRKIRTAPIHNGRSSYLSVVQNKELELLGSSIAEKVNIKGPVKIDFKYDDASKSYYLLEINPRYNLWHYLGAVNGVNLPEIAYSYYTGSKSISNSSVVTTNIRWLDFSTDRKAFVELWKIGEMSLVQWLWSLRGQKIYNVFSWTDPLPFIYSIVNRAGNKARRVAGKMFR